MKPKKLSRLSILICTLSTLMVSGRVFADDDICGNSNVPYDVRKAAGCEGGGATELPDVVIGILNAVIGVAGIISVAFIIMGGIQYMTSTGDPGKIKKAKDTILYACIGLIVCALAFAIVNWVIDAL